MDVPAVDDGSAAAQFFVGTETMVCDAHGMKTDKQFVNSSKTTFSLAVPPKLISDHHAQVEISKKVQDILRTLFILAWQSEPHQQQQNFAERCFQTIKNAAN